MTAGNAIFTIEQGSTFSRTILWEDVNGNPINLTSYTAAMVIRPSDGTTPITLTNGSGITLGGSLGTIIIAISATDTGNFTFQSATYELRLTTGSTVTRLLQGGISISPTVF